MRATFHALVLFVALAACTVGADQIRIRQGTPAAGGGGGGTGTCDADHLADCPLLTQEMLFGDLDGGFCPPDYSNNGLYVDFSPGWSMAHDPADNTMWLTTGSGFGGKGIAHITIPSPTLTTNPASMTMASYVGTPAIIEPTEGDFPNSFPDTPSADGILTTPTALLPWGTKICGSFQYYYESGGPTTHPFYCHSKNLATAGHDGMMTFTPTGSWIGNREMTAFCGLVPSIWQSALGGPAFCGAGASYSVISNQSYGPSITIINPDNITTGSGSVRALQHYPATNATLGGWDLGNYGAGEMMDFSTQILGGVMIDGTRTAIFYGKTGTQACYGVGLSDPNDPRIGTPTGSGEDLYCLDPTFPDHGNHGYPYAPRIWAVDMLDYIRVLASEINTWDIIPYGFWDITSKFPISNNGSFAAGGMTYDPVNKWLYLAQKSAGCSGNNAVIWRFTVDITP